MLTRVRLFRLCSRSCVTLQFSDLGISWLMGDDAILAHVRALMPRWELISVEEGEKARFFQNSGI